MESDAPDENEESSNDEESDEEGLFSYSDDADSVLDSVIAECAPTTSGATTSRAERASDATAWWLRPAAAPAPARGRDAMAWCFQPAAAPAHVRGVLEAGAPRAASSAARPAIDGKAWCFLKPTAAPMPMLAVRAAPHAAATSRSAAGVSSSELAPRNLAGAGRPPIASASSMVMVGAAGSDGRGRHSRVGCKRRVAFAVEAFLHHERGLGRLCEASCCPNGGRCSGSLTHNEISQCHEYSFGTDTKGRRDDATKEPIECSCTVRCKEAHNKWAELILKCHTTSAVDGTVQVLFHVGSKHGVCAEAMRVAYGINRTFWDSTVRYARCAPSRADGAGALARTP